MVQSLAFVTFLLIPIFEVSIAQAEHRHCGPVVSEHNQNSFFPGAAALTMLRDAESVFSAIHALSNIYFRMIDNYSPLIRSMLVRLFERYVILRSTEPLDFWVAQGRVSVNLRISYEDPRTRTYVVNQHLRISPIADPEDPGQLGVRIDIRIPHQFRRLPIFMRMLFIRLIAVDLGQMLGSISSFNRGHEVFEHYHGANSIRVFAILNGIVLEALLVSHLNSALVSEHTIKEVQNLNPVLRSPIETINKRGLKAYILDSIEFASMEFPGFRDKKQLDRLLQVLWKE